MLFFAHKHGVITLATNRKRQRHPARSDRIHALPPVLRRVGGARARRVVPGAGDAADDGGDAEGVGWGLYGACLSVTLHPSLYSPCRGPGGSIEN